MSLLKRISLVLVAAIVGVLGLLVAPAQAAPQPTAYIGLNVTVVVNTTHNYTAAVNSTQAPITGQSWTVVSGPDHEDVGRVVSTTRFLSYTPRIVGTYVIEYQATNQYGTGFDRKTLTVVPQPAPVVTPPQTQCRPFGSGVICEKNPGLLSRTSARKVYLRR